MRATITRAALHEACDRTSGAVGKEGLQSNAHLRAGDVLLVVTTTDYSMAARHVAQCTVDQAGEAIVSQRTLSTIVGSLPKDGVVEIADTPSGGVRLLCGRAKFDLESLPDADFPEVLDLPDDAINASLPARTIREAFAATVPFVYQAADRPALQCALFNLHDAHLSVVSTDGSRLAAFGRDVDSEIPNCRFLVLRQHAAEILRLLPTDGEVDLTLSPTRPTAVFTLQRTRLQIRALKENFPDYCRVIPSHDNVCKVRRDDLAAASRRVGTLSADRMMAVSFGRAELELECTRQGAGHSSDAVSCQYDGPNFRVWLDWRFLVEALAHFGETVDVHVGGNRFDPVLLTSDETPGLRHVLMPMLD